MPTELTSPPKPLSSYWICFIVSTLSTLAVSIATSSFRHYGYALFLGVPIVMGLFIAFLYQHGRIGRWGDVLRLAFFCMLLTALWLLICKVEGMGCILMAAFLVATMVLIGVVISWGIQASVRRKQRRSQLHCLAISSLPLMMSWEENSSATPSLIEQTTVIEIDASPDAVWKYVPAFPAITHPPAGWLAASLAYPIRSEVDGAGVGATRRCVLSTGTMPEIVTCWEPGKLLEFVVTETPPTMVEQNPFGRVEAAHLEGYFQAHRGRFTLTALPGGRTRVTGTSWFSQNLWPHWYWQPIARHTVSSVHQRVLQHIKTLAENQSR